MSIKPLSVEELNSLDELLRLIKVSLFFNLKCHIIVHFSCAFGNFLIKRIIKWMFEYYWSEYYEIVKCLIYEWILFFYTVASITGADPLYATFGLLTSHRLYQMLSICYVMGLGYFECFKDGKLKIFNYSNQNMSTSNCNFYRINY